MEELDWLAQSPDLNPIEYLWDELESRLQARPNHPTSVPDLVNALVAKWKQVPGAMLQEQVKSLPGRVEAVIAAKTGPTSYYRNEMFNEQVSTYFWSYSVNQQNHPMSHMPS